MSKTFTYVLLVIGAYILIVFPKVVKEKQAEEKAEKKNDYVEIKPSEGAEGQLKYRFGVTM